MNPAGDPTANHKRLIPAIVALMVIPTAAIRADWEITDKPGELRVANGKIGVVMTRQDGQPAAITLLAADKAGNWQTVCRTLRPDFAKNPAR